MELVSEAIVFAVKAHDGMRRRKGDAMWQRFHQSDPSVQAWYYSTIAELTKPLAHTAAWEEYKTLTDLVFKKG